jgi:hypothetical protein
MRHRKTLRGINRPHQDPGRPHEVTARFQNELEGDQLLQQIKELEDEKKKLEEDNLHLKIDVGVRRELINRAREEMTRLRTMADSLLRENGALGYQIQQLAAPANKIGIDAPHRQLNVQQSLPADSEQDDSKDTQAFDEPRLPDQSVDQRISEETAG